VPRSTPRPVFFWLITFVCAAACLAWALRHAPLGVAVADDYSFLDRLSFQHPLDPFDSMGGSFYWRPLSRQAYFSAIGPFLLAAPWIVPLLHGVVLALTSFLLYRVGRKLGWTPLACAFAAASPVLAEPSRVLLTWPSAAQHLLAMFCVVLALHEGVHGRAWRAAGAAWLGLLAHESSAVVLLVLPFLGKGPWWRRVVPVLAAVGLWQVGYRIALGHGVALPHHEGELAPDLATALRLGVFAALGLEDKGGAALLVGYGLVLLVAVGIAAFGRRARQRVTSAAPALLAALGAYALGTLPLAVLLPDWNAWRDTVPGLALGVGLTAFVALASPTLGALFVVLRAVALLGAMPAVTQVDTYAPTTTSDMSFARITRLQRIADAARHAVLTDLRDRTPPLEIRTVHNPRMSEVAFQGSRALRVWLDDSTATWRSLGGQTGLYEAPGPVLVYDLDTTLWQAVLLQPAALTLFRRGMDESTARRFPEAESLFVLAGQTQPRHSMTFQSFLDANVGRAHFFQGRFAVADSFNESSRILGGEDTNYWALRGAIELMRGDRAAALRSAKRSLEFMPTNPFGKYVAEQASL